MVQTTNVIPFPIMRPRLKPQEIAILRGVARGLRHREIAQELGYSEHTINTYIKRIRDKLNANTHAHAVTIAKDFGLI